MQYKGVQIDCLNIQLNLNNRKISITRNLKTVYKAVLLDCLKRCL